jgi:hypothetical protein
MDAFIMKENEVIGIETNTGKSFYGPVILATGHSARDVYNYLYERQIQIEAKGIAVGVRLEHFSIRSKISDVGFIEVSPPFHSYILDVTNWLPSPCKGHYPSRTTMEPPLPYPANEPDLGNPQLALCIG